MDLGEFDYHGYFCQLMKLPAAAYSAEVATSATKTRSGGYPTKFPEAATLLRQSYGGFSLPRDEEESCQLVHERMFYLPQPLPGPYSLQILADSRCLDQLRLNG